MNNEVIDEVIEILDREYHTDYASFCSQYGREAVDKMIESAGNDVRSAIDRFVVENDPYTTKRKTDLRRGVL